MRHRLGWKPQHPDLRDWKFALEKPIPMPPAVDLRSVNPPIFDQGNLGSCTANAAIGAIGMLMIKEKKPLVPLSRLDLYYNERVIEGTALQDAGATIRDSMKAAVKYGICTEALWPYGDASTFADPPKPRAIADALTHRLKSYLAVLNVYGFKQSLALGFPVVFGVTVYDSFESDSVAVTGVIPLPDPSESVLGGHALCAVGYRDASQVIIFRNSWSTLWGDKGYGYIPYSYIDNEDLASDFWTPRLY